MRHGQAELQQNASELQEGTMKTIETRFGAVEYGPENVLRFPEGLIGFESLREFIVMPSEKIHPLFWIQSVEDPEVAFLLTDPTNFFLDYKVVPDKRECAKLGIAGQDDCHTLSVVTVHRDKTVTLNLQAPILLAPKPGTALQVILEKTKYQSRTPLPELRPKEKAKADESAAAAS